MAGFVPKDKMSKKAQKELNSKRRVIWEVRPVTKTVESKKIYSRKRKAGGRDDYGPGGNDEAVYHSDIPFLCVDDYRNLAILLKEFIPHD